MADEYYSLGHVSACIGVPLSQLMQWRQAEKIRVSHKGYTIEQIRRIIGAYPLVDEMKIIQNPDAKAVELYRELKRLGGNKPWKKRLP